MNEVLDRDDRSRALDAFAARPADDASLAPAQVFAAPAERVFGAQPVSVKRDEGDILRKLKTLAAAAGEKWYYRFPVKKKVKNEQTGKDEWVQDFIEGPSIKCANNVARLYGNCDIDTRVFDVGAYYMFYARFMDLETGYSITRPFKQRKSQKAMRTDSERADDIVFQIGASKAIRNVVTNALEFFTDFAWNEAKNSIIEQVGRKLEHYKAKVLERLAELNIDIKLVEVVRGRSVKDWLAADVARTIAEIQAINDGMATVEETYVGIDPDTGEVKAGSTSTASSSTGAAEAADAGAAGQAGTTQETGSGPDKAGPAVNSNSAQAQPSAKPQAETVAAPGPAADKSKSPPSTKDEAAAGGSEQKPPKNEAEYITHASAWIDALDNADAGEKQWKDEKNLRNKANVGSDARETLQEKLAKKCAEIRDADRS